MRAKIQTVYKRAFFSEFRFHLIVNAFKLFEGTLSAGDYRLIRYDDCKVAGCVDFFYRFGRFRKQFEVSGVGDKTAVFVYRAVAVKKNGFFA